MEIVGVQFKSMGKVYFFAPGKLNIKVGDNVIVETAQGQEYGKVTIPVSDVSEDKIVAPLKNVVRVATESDTKQLEENRRKEKEAFKICNERIQKHKLDMKLISVEYAFDCSKILFYFTSGGRVDFRELVKDLASVFRTRIELRQIGVRDEAKMIGGLGICGRSLCCKSYLNDFQPVSIKMAKEQNLSLNPTKISGSCGRLMCCLKYEQDTYEDLLRVIPRIGSVVKTPDGTGSVIDTYILSERVRVKIEKGEDFAVKDYSVKDIKVISEGKGKKEKHDDVDIEELKKLEDK